MSKKYIWLTDIHLNFLKDEKIIEFFLNLKFKQADGIFLTGDISNGLYITKHLAWLQKITDLPIYFVLGNHDFYKSSFTDVEYRVSSLVKNTSNLHYLTISEPIALNDTTAIIGHDGWYDAGWHEPMTPLVFLADWYFIEDFKFTFSNKRRMILIRDRALQAAERLEQNLKKAFQTYDTIYLLTHFPPWPPMGFGLRNRFWRPYNSSKIVADYIIRSMPLDKNKKLIVLSGHTHEHRYTKISENIELRVGEAELKNPSISNIIVID